MEILSGEEMQNVDRRAIESLGIPGLQLMEAAGAGVARALLHDWRPVLAAGVLVVCGKGNNGGDGLVIARHLVREGVRARVFLIAEPTSLTGDVATNLRAAQDAGVEILVAADVPGLGSVAAAFAECGLIVDAILGTGIRGGARGLAAEAIARINTVGAMGAAGATGTTGTVGTTGAINTNGTIETTGTAGAAGIPVIAVDLPSGLDAASHRVTGVAVRASHTYTLCRPKVCLALDPAARFAGSFTVIPIGIPDEAVAAEHARLEWLDADAARTLVPRRDAAAHKGHCGHLLVVAGARGKAGAAVLAARGALRAGAGLVTVATPVSSLPVVAAQQAEIMTEPLPETAAGQLSRRAEKPALALAADRDALAVGPGLGTNAGTREAILALIAGCRLPTVVDADALNAWAMSGKRAFRGRTRPLVVTPHPGEASRLLACTTEDIEDDRLAAARQLAERLVAVVVLKGRHSVVAHPDGRAAINGSGNPGMATAGSGDVLTGVIGAFLARGLSAWDAARLGAWVHGAAGDRARDALGEEGLIASDIAGEIPGVLRDLASDVVRARPGHHDG